VPGTETERVRRCPRCDRELPAAAFAHDRSKPGGSNSLCKECDRKKSRRYYWQHREAVIARVSAYNRARRTE
jgi:hypothetical protein